MKTFPEGFHWGAATASYQVEGGIENCDWAEAARADRVPVCGRACDHYNQYETDFDIAKSLGHNAHRFSIEWARIEPEEGQFDMGAIEHYRDVLRALRARGIVPYITLWHFTLPIWFARRGGFECTDAPALFARYATFVVHQLGDLCNHMSTMNEPNVYATHGWLYGAWPPFRRGRILWRPLSKEDGTSRSSHSRPSFGNVLRYFKVVRNLTKTHVMTYRSIKQIKPDLEVSVVKHVHVFAAGDKWYQKLLAQLANSFQSYQFLDAVRNDCDAIGLNYYRYTKFGDNKNYLLTDMDWKAHPNGIYDALMLLKRYRKPVFVAEAGLADEDDDMRAAYIRLQVKGVEKALLNGVDVRGHMYWSLLDNYEWALGFEKRFGLVAINYDTMERTVRPSADVYKEIIAQNGVVE